MRATSRVAVTVRGMVQGVGFRAFVLRAAIGLRLDGWVANRPDGSVELVAEGPADAIERLLEAVREGPPGCWVDDVAVRPEVPTQAGGGFAIRAAAHAGD